MVPRPRTKWGLESSSTFLHYYYLSIKVVPILRREYSLEWSSTPLHYDYLKTDHQVQPQMMLNIQMNFRNNTTSVY